MRESVINFNHKAISNQNIDFFNVETNNVNEVNNANKTNNNCVTNFLDFLLCFVRI